MDDTDTNIFRNIKHMWKGRRNKKISIDVDDDDEKEEKVKEKEGLGGWRRRRREKKWGRRKRTRSIFLSFILVLGPVAYMHFFLYCYTKYIWT